jgi:hypothetical protein
MRHERLTERDRHGLCPSMDAELPQQILTVGVHGLRAEKEPLGDVACLQAVREEREHLALARREPHRDVRRDRARATNEAVDSDQELIRRDRLGQVLVAADQQACDAVVRLRPGARQKDDGERVAEPLAQSATDLIAADARQTDVEERKLRRLVLREEERLFAGPRLDDRVAAAGERRRGARTSLVIVVDDQQVSRLAGRVRGN